MEDAEDLWSHCALEEGYEDAWHLSQTRNHTEDGTSSYKCGDTGDGSYEMSIHAALISPFIELGADARLVFWHWMDVHAIDDSTAGDGGCLEIRPTEDPTWSPLYPLIGGYGHRWRQADGPFFFLAPLWSGGFDWSQVLVELDAYEGEIIRFRYRFGTRGGEPTGEGWFIDDVLVHVPDPLGAAEIVRPFTDLRLEPSRPNPFSSSTTIRYRLGRALPVRVEIFDVRGRVVRSYDRGMEEEGDHAVLWDGTNQRGRPVGAGIYCTKVQAGWLFETGRIALLR